LSLFVAISRQVTDILPFFIAISRDVTNILPFFIAISHQVTDILPPFTAISRHKYFSLFPSTERWAYGFKTEIIEKFL
jgi:hypothetical protein